MHQTRGRAPGVRRQPRDSRRHRVRGARGGRLHQGHQGASALPHGKHKVGSEIINEEKSQALCYIISLP